MWRRSGCVVCVNMGSLVNHPFKVKRDCWIAVEASICGFWKTHVWDQNHFLGIWFCKTSKHKKNNWNGVLPSKRGLGRENAWPNKHLIQLRMLRDLQAGKKFSHNVKPALLKPDQTGRFNHEPDIVPVRTDCFTRFGLIYSILIRQKYYITHTLSLWQQITKQKSLIRKFSCI